MRIGQRNMRVRFEERTDAQDDAGQPRRIWSLFAAAWVSLTPATASQPVVQDQKDAGQRWLIEADFIPALRTDMRVAWEDPDSHQTRTADIVKAADPTGMRRVLEIEAVEKT